MNYFEDENNVYYGHGTGANNYQVLNSINNNGLRFSHEQLSFTTIPLGNGSKEMLQNIGQKGQQWEHNNSKYIVIASIPQEYEIMEVAGNDSYGKKDYAVSYEVNEVEAGLKNISPGRYLRPEFILGYYDANKNKVIINPKYYKTLPQEKQTELFQEINKNYNELVEKTWGIEEYKSMLNDMNESIQNEKDKWKSPLLKKEKWNKNYKTASKEELLNMIMLNINRIPANEQHPEAYNDYIAIELITEQYIKKFNTPKDIKELMKNIDSLDRTTTNKKMFMAIAKQIKEEINKHQNQQQEITAELIVNNMKKINKYTLTNDQNYRNVLLNSKLYLKTHNTIQELNRFTDQILNSIDEMDNIQLTADVLKSIRAKALETKQTIKENENKQKLQSLEEQDIIKKTKHTIEDFQQNKDFNINTVEDLLLLLKRQQRSMETLSKETLKNNYDLYDELEEAIRKCSNQVEQVTEMNRKMSF